MTRAECEKQISELAKEIKSVYFQYMDECGVKDDYLSLTIWGDGIRCNNSSWEHEDGKVDFWEEVV